PSVTCHPFLSLFVENSGPHGPDGRVRAREMAIENSAVLLGGKGYVAGRPIARAYMARIEKFGIVNILDLIADGETMNSVADKVQVNRWFLSTYLNKDSYVADALTLCRAQAAQKRLAAHPKGEGPTDVRRWVEAAPERHLDALKAIRQGDGD